MEFINQCIYISSLYNIITRLYLMDHAKSAKEGLDILSEYVIGERKKTEF